MSSLISSLVGWKQSTATDSDNRVLLWTLASLIPLAVLIIYTSWSISSKAKAKSASADKSSSGTAFTPDQVAHLIRKRRSVFPKDYNGKSVSREEVEQMLEAANWAPTHNRTEPWRFVVLEGAAKERLLDVTEQASRTVLPPEKLEAKLVKMAKKRKSAYPKVDKFIAICVKRRPARGKPNPEWEEVASVSCAVQNLHLMATALGVAGYWSSWGEEQLAAPEFKEFLGLEPEDKCLGVFCIGRSDYTEGYRSKRGPIADKVTWMS